MAEQAIDPADLAEFRQSQPQPQGIDQSDAEEFARLTGKPMPAPRESQAGDIAKSTGSGLVKGVIGMAGLPGDVRGLVGAGVKWVGGKLGLPEPPAGGNQPPDIMPRSSAIRGAVEGVTGPLYEPQTTGGQYAGTASEFIPGALAGGSGLVKNALKYGVLPGLTSETAGQLTKGTGFEPYARAGASILTVGGAAALSRSPSAQQALRAQLPDYVTQAHIDRAGKVIEAASQRGINLTWPEALSKVTGKDVLTDVQRMLESTAASRPRMQEFLGDRPQQIRGAAGPEMDAIGSVPSTPSSLGRDVSEVAGQSVAASPEGRILADTVERAGPRISPGDAGAVIQPELRSVYDRREGMRAALADQDYAAARNAPATVPANGDFRVADVDLHYPWPKAHPVVRGSDGQMRRMTPQEEAAANLEAPVPVHPVTRGEGGRMRRMTEDEIAAEQASRWDAINEQRSANQEKYNITVRRPIVGERPTEFVQVDAEPVIRGIDSALDNAKGAVRQGLQAAKSALMKPNGEIDRSVAGLHNSRVAITDLISQAKQAGANNTVRELENALNILDDTLERVPSYGQARRNFKAASEPLKPFEPDRAPGRIIERDQYNQRHVMPVEQVPGVIERGGGTAARDFNQVATPAAKQAFEQHITTQVLESAQRNGVHVDAQVIRNAIRQNEDLLRQYPGVRDRLESIAIARGGLDRVMQSPIGRLAATDMTTKKAVDALFPSNPIPNSQHEISEAVSSIAQRRPAVAEQLVRTHAEMTFNEAVQNLQGGASGWGGAKFAAVIAGNPQQRANLRAAVEALPGGTAKWKGFESFLDILEATGKRQAIGSKTAFNAQELKGLESGNAAFEAAKLAGQPFKVTTFVGEKLAAWKAGKNLDQLASILTDPGSGKILKRIAAMPSGGREAQYLAGRIVLQLPAMSSTHKPVQ